MNKCIRGFDINRRIAIPRAILEALNIDYETDQMEITIVNDSVVLKKVRNENECVSNRLEGE